MGELYIVYASDDRFAEILGVSLVSLYENNKLAENIIIYILDSGISEENKNRIEEVSKYYMRDVPCWIKAKDVSKELQIDVSIDRGSLSQYARLFVSSVLPENLERVLYLDCDIIINQPIEELWNLDMEGKTIAALMDAFSKWYRKNIELQPNDIMFNSGVMLIDLKRWREQKIEEDLLKFILKKNGCIQQGDQGVLNAILSHNIKCFDPKFNAVTIFYDFSYDEMLIYRKPPKFYSREEVGNAVDNPVIIHFTTSFLSCRPWNEGCQHKYVNRWLEYKLISPWKDEKMWKNQKISGVQGIYKSFVKFLPRKLMIHISGILQAYVRPIIRKIK